MLHALFSGPLANASLRSPVPSTLESEPRSTVPHTIPYSLPPMSDTATEAFPMLVDNSDSDPRSDSDHHRLPISHALPSKSKNVIPSVSKPRPFPCFHPGCVRRFTRRYTRKVHMDTHSRTKPRKSFLCTVEGCDEYFSRKHDRLRHEAGKHGKEGEWQCGKCGRCFSSQTTMERHMLNEGH